MERRSSDDDNRRPRQAPNPNVFDDEYALDAEEDFMPAVSDGFRPANASQGWAGDRHHHDRDRDAPQRPSFSATKSSDSTDMRRMASRNSTMKTPFAREMASQDAQQSGTHSRLPGSQSTPLQHRASISSTGSFATMARSESPLGGGPSHPYGMYPQNTMARTSSVTASPTPRQPHRSVSLQRPTHPYGMYTQNVEETPDEPAMPAPQAAIQVGFPGLGVNAGFHRQIGPDGEEQDIIGPDGHTEQLPPYTRYPEEGPTKAALAAEASATPVETTPPPLPLPLPLPLSASNDALVPPPSQPTPQQPDTPAREVPVATTTSAASTTSTSDSGISEKNEAAVSAGSWRKRRLWGKVPMGVVVILLVLVLVFAIILGAAIGTFVAKNRDKDNDNNNSKNRKGDNDPAPQVSPGNTLFDASPIPTPTPGLSLPTGPFALPLGVPQEANPGCLTQANQASAWSCKLSFVPLTFIINDTTPENQKPLVSIGPAFKPDGTVQYGIQAPLLFGEDLQLVADFDYPRYGPAFHFQTLYDKVVVLNSDEFQEATSRRKRQGGDKPPFRQRFQVLPGDTPWFCHWNGTFIEGYIYVSNNSSAATRTGPPPFPTSDPYASSVSVDPAAASTTDSAGSPTTPVASEGSPTPTQFRVVRRGDGDGPRFPAYPRIVKIEERRLPGSPQPYCQKMRLLDNNHFTEAKDSNGHDIVVLLQELDPPLQQFLSAPPPSQPSSPNGNSTRRDLEKRTDPAGACHCQWMFM